MMQRILNRASSSIASGAVVLGLAGLFSRLLGVYRDRLLATTFGAGASLDIYYAAFRIPDFVFNLLVLGALSAGFIPVFSAYLKENEESAWKLAESVLFLLLSSLGILSIIIFIIAPWLIPLITPGFDQEMISQTILLTRIMLLSPILLGVSGVFGGVLQTFKRFIAYSLAPILYNAGIIFGLFFFIEPFGLAGLAWGVVLGAFMHLIMQGFVAHKLGWKWSLKNVWQYEGLKEIISLMGPRSVSLLLLQANLLIITIFASTLEEGSLTIFNFASNLAHVPIGLFGISFAVSAFPLLSKQFATNKLADFSRTVYSTLSQILFFLFPTLVFIALLDEQIVRLVYGAGEFYWDATLTTAKTLLYLIPGIFAQGLLPIISRAFYAQKNTKHPLYAAAFGVVVTIIASYLLTQVYTFGVIGLAIAFSLASFFQLIAQSIWLKLQSIESKKTILHTMTELFLASIGMLLTLQLTKDLSGPLFDLTSVRGVMLHFLLPGAIGAITYLGLLKLLNNDEYLYYENTIKGRIRFFEKVFVPEVGQGEEDDVTL